MAVPTRVAEAFRESEEAVRAVERHAGDAIRIYCEDKGYLFSGRRKSLTSLAEKLESGRFEAWSEIDDLYACTIVVPTSSHELNVFQYLEAAFEKIEFRERNTTQKAPETFRFDASRFIGRIRNEVGQTLVPGASGISFEVQLLTAFEYAWQVATHDLVYKSDRIDWQRARLASQLKAAVEQIEMIIDGFESAVPNIPTSPHPETEAKIQVIETFQRLIDGGVISPELRPESWSRFGDNVFNLVRSFSNRFQAPGRAIALAEAAEAELTASGSTRDLHSGSLFQVVLGLVGSGILDSGRLDSFVVIQSPELRDLHSISDVPKAFNFDE